MALFFYPYPHQKWATYPNQKWPGYIYTPTKFGLPPPPNLGYEILFYYLKNKYSALRSFFELRFNDLRKTSSNRQLKRRLSSDGIVNSFLRYRTDTQQQ
ncbi:hypothetical protein D9J20_02015 [Escherichia coli]|nr:hypothetical protein [Escherichia coli]